ncbi:UvrD-helicase domain-containing protein [Ornithinimicrobium sp. CNJ-824]|uniref:UvrD-helicase domain-containing protein n=1 Tax=Ornithinimicrobium sp. CNJ-824 TaxID=1904966 RepID=UPI000A721C00|nr:UvrD-helicase domain-containing protein [Ornithinimicrobium sp. CNJ-824]
MEHFDITDPLPQGTVLLEASAGTGKTWTIAALVARFVAEGEADLRDLLVVTFSRAASQELRARVREQLVLVERCLRERSCPPGDALVAHLLAADEETVRVMHRRVRAALTDFDAATIATVHQFCQEVLRSLGVAGTTDASATLVEDLDDLLVDVVDDIYLRGFRNDRKVLFNRSAALQIARTAVDDIHAGLRPETAEPRSVPARRAGFARAVRTEFDVRKRRLQVMHYNDLLTQLADALEDPDSLARDRMRARWQVVLVDEFQDTDPVQWQVLDRAFTGHCRAMVLIGDPKQAIYGFRGGDIATYLTAAEAAGERRTLPRNYRSDAGVVRALGTLLEAPSWATRRSSSTRSRRPSTSGAWTGPPATPRCGCGRCCWRSTSAAATASARSASTSSPTSPVTWPLCSGRTRPSTGAPCGPATWPCSRTRAATSSGPRTRCGTWGSTRSAPAACPSCRPGPPTSGSPCWRRWSPRTGRC